MAEERSALAAVLEEVQGRVDKLEEELTHSTGETWRKESRAFE